MKFSALFINQGDAFLYERNERIALIDGGRSEAIVCAELHNKKVTHIDYLVCTHNDSDHANGVIGVLKDYSIKINEVWVPATWSQAEDILSESNTEDVIDSILSTSERLSSENQSNSFSIEESDFEDFNYLPHSRAEKCQICNIARILIAAGDRIKEIIAISKRRGLRIRYFEHQDFSQQVLPNQGEQGFLICTSANEITLRKKSISTIGDLLYLTLVNREALVFFSPEDDHYPAVLFCSDSNLDTFNLNGIHIPKRAIATSPHHGSADNLNGFKIISNYFSSTSKTWVRSDNYNKKRPATWYTGIIETRLRTRCNDHKTSNPNISLDQTLNSTSLTKCQCT